MALSEELSTFYKNFHNGGVPKEVSQTILAASADFKSTFDHSKAIQIGSQLPNFSLPNATGSIVTSTGLLSSGPILISFYRGDWCPYCNTELRALQKLLPQFTAKGVTLVAITPQLPDTTLTSVEKLQLDFQVLSDVGNVFARELGLVWKQPEAMVPLFKGIGVDWKKSNGDESYEVPVPGTLLVDENGVVRNTFIDPDYVKRLEPATALEWVDAL